MLSPLTVKNELTCLPTLRVWVKSGPAVLATGTLQTAQRVLAKDQAARRVLDQGQGPNKDQTVLGEHGKI